MILKEITYSQLKEAIKISFDGDMAIYKFYDNNVKVESLNEIVNDIYAKIKDYGEGIVLKGVYENDELIGYVVKYNDLLISFSISVKYRSKNNTKEFFRLIKNDFNNRFFCYLWGVNKRAIKWLEKNGMKIIFNDNQLIKLQCL